VAHPEEYDVVCAFHAIEHVTDPLGFARPRNLHETRRTSLCCGAEPRFGNNRDSEFRAECAAASSQPESWPAIQPRRILISGTFKTV